MYLHNQFDEGFKESTEARAAGLQVSEIQMRKGLHTDMTVMPSFVREPGRVEEKEALAASP